MIDIQSLRTEDIQVLSAEQAWHYRIIPKAVTGNKVIFFVDETQRSTTIQSELEIILDKHILLEPVSTTIINEALGYHYRKGRNDGNNQDLKKNLSSHSDDFLTTLIESAKNVNSSDIHLEIYEHRCRVRVRIDGLMVERYVIEKTTYPSLINKIKILANLDIAEKRLPQDGRIFFTTHNNQKMDIRVSVLPTLHGEKVVLRLLNNDATNIDINLLGFSTDDLDNYLEAIKRPNGIVLISGPTGSGKTTTLYATLKLLNKTTRNILTIEDPIEYTLEGINQVQLKENIGMNFGSAMRTFLRQDPDVIMVGEIRDPDTAAMAIRASLTGHLVLSTIHTNSAWGTISRLVDMGIPKFLLANTLNLSVAQRLLRLLCKTCKVKENFKASVYPKQFKPYRTLEHHYIVGGCEDCFYTGYKGRKAVYEVIPIDAELAEDIKLGASDVKENITRKGIKTLTENAFELFAQGETSIEEIYPLLFNY